MCTHCAPQAWTNHRLNMAELLQRIRQRPLIEVLHFITESEHHHAFRDLGTSIWVSAKRLDINASTARLSHHSKDALGRFHCPVIACKKNYKYHGKLAHHLHKHEEFYRLSAEMRDQVMNELTFNVPPDSGMRCTVLSAEAYAALQPSGATQGTAVL